jgi:hypothetical protein
MEVEMMRASWTGILCGAIAALGSAPSATAEYQRGRAGHDLSVRWIGQDGHDYVTTRSRPEPDDKQDIHFTVGGLDPRREIAFVEVSIPSGHRWEYNGKAGNWAIEVRRNKGAKVADLFVALDRPDIGPVWHVLVRYDDGSTAEADLRSRKVNPFLRVASEVVQARWVGQDRHDYAAAGPGVGPDGLQDARVHLSALSAKVPVKSVRIEAAPGSGWEFGMNPKLLNNAEFIKDPKDPKQGDLYFQPDRDLAGQRLRLSLVYEDGSPDAVAVAAGRCDPKLRMSQAPIPKVEELKLSARWLGQDRSHPTRPGDVHVLLGGLPSSSRIAAISLTDTVREAWQYRASDRVPALLDGSPGSLDVRIRPDRKTADLYFTPYRDASRDTFSVRVVAADGRTWHGLFPGGSCDLTRLAPAPETSRAQARPGDDLQVLLDRNGTVVLARGTYRLRHPLVLNRPAMLKAEAGATLVFAQDPSDQPWTTAVKVRCSNTTLDGFAVRFEGRIRWNQDVSYGPAVIGLTDSFEPGYNESKHNVVFRNLDLEIPPADDASKWVEALRLYRLVGGFSGAIIGNRLRGGPIEFYHGPWQILDNDFRGTLPGTFSHSFVVGHYTHDLLIRGNRLSSAPPSGKTWRFLVLTGSGLLDRVERNVIEGIGARDDDTIPWSNEPEIILTEDYLLKYEGKVLAASADGKVLRVGQPQGPEVKPGDVVAILNGPAAGQWRRVQHVLDPSAYLIDQPLPKESDVVSISQAFVSEAFEGNRIDIRGGKRSDGFVLPGNHFGARIVDNHVLGGGLAFRISAYATENPMIWGWSHVPYLGGAIERNFIEDNDQGASFCVEHSAAIKTNKGRTYMSMQLRNNVVRWTEPFLSQRVRARTRQPLPGLMIGSRPSADPNELLIEASANGLDAPPGYRESAGLVVHAAQFNGQKVVDRKFKLPAAKGSGEGGRREARTGASRSVR